jgi:uncharacterized protein (TIGR03437 family)
MQRGVCPRQRRRGSKDLRFRQRELTFQAPFSLSGSTATVQVTSTLSGQSLSSAVITVPVAATNPGLFSAGGTGSGTGYYFDGSGLIAEYSQAVQPGDTVVLFATGFGATNPAVATGALGPTPGAAATATVTMTVNNVSVPVTFAGLEPGSQSGATVGYDEVVFTVPSGLTQGPYPMVVTVGGVASQSVNLIVGQAPVTITSVSPSPVPLSANPQTVTFNGTGFESGLTLRLQSPGLVVSTVSGSNITFVSSTQFTAQITVGTTAGSWGALVDNPDGTESSVFNFTASGNAPPSTATITKIVTTSSHAPRDLAECLDRSARHESGDYHDDLEQLEFHQRAADNPRLRERNGGRQASGDFLRQSDSGEHSRAPRRRYRQCIGAVDHSQWRGFSGRHRSADLARVPGVRRRRPRGGRALPIVQLVRTAVARSARLHLHGRFAGRGGCDLRHWIRANQSRIYQSAYKYRSDGRRSVPHQSPFAPYRDDREFAGDGFVRGTGGSGIVPAESDGARERSGRRPPILASYNGVTTQSTA